MPRQNTRTLAGMAAAAAVGQALRSGGRRTVAREAVVAGLSLLPAMLALRGRELARPRAPPGEPRAGRKGGALLPRRRAKDDRRLRAGRGRRRRGQGARPLRLE